MARQHGNPVCHIIFCCCLFYLYYQNIAHKLKYDLFILSHNVFILNLVLILLDLKVQGDRCGGQSRFGMIHLIDRYKNRARTNPPDDPCLTGFCSGHRTRSKVRDFHLKDLKTTPTADRRLLHRTCSIKKVSRDSETMKCCGTDMQNFKLAVDATKKLNIFWKKILKGIEDDTENFFPDQTDSL